MWKILIAVGLLLLIVGGILAGFLYQNNKYKKEFDIFYSSYISGKIIKIDKYSRGSNFVLENNPRKFSFYPYVDEHLNNNEIFQYLATPGDSIYKPAYSDTLLLIRGNRIYSYTFQKINN